MTRRLAFAILALSATGCTTLKWTCDVPVTITLRDTSTEVRCQTPEHSVTITHPKGTRVGP